MATVTTQSSSTRKQEDSEPSTGRTWLVPVSTALVAVFWVGIVLSTGLPLSSFRSMFRDMGAALPSFTEALLSISKETWLTAGLAGPIALFAKDRFVSRNVSLLLNGFAASALVLFEIVVSRAVFIPFLEIIHAIE